MPAAKQVELAPTPQRFSQEYIDQHNADMKRLKAEQDSREDLLRECLNPKTARDYENKKPEFIWNVDIVLVSRNEETDDWEKLTEPLSVVAQDENTAWAKACDKLSNPKVKLKNPSMRGLAPGSRDRRRSKITQVKQVEK